MAVPRIRFRAGDVSGYLSSLRGIEEQMEGLRKKDVTALRNESVAHLQSLFPKATERRTSFNEDNQRVSRGTPLWSGWRTFTLADGGFVIRHARASNPRIALILTSIDRGSRAYKIRLKHAKAFRFFVRGEKVIVTGGRESPRYIQIPARKPMPGRQGYLSPTRAFMLRRIEELKEARLKEIKRLHTRRR